VSTRQLLAPKPRATAQEIPMQAIVHSRYGPPDVLEVKDIDKPAINNDAVLV
jgi:hypothetical protein